MTSYTEIIYPSDEGNPYPKKLSNYLYERFFNANTTGKKMLEVGCCTGRFLKHFSDKGLDCYGIDIRAEKQDFAFDFRACDLEKDAIPYPDNHFDFIYSKSVIEHVKNTDNFLESILRVLKPGGVFVTLTPDWKTQFKDFWNDYTHVKPFTKKSLRDAMMIHGYKDVECELFYQLPFVWERPSLQFIPRAIASLVPDSFKWKDSEERNTKDRKLIRFSKELMLLAYAKKPEEA
jgi:SAM-dependent methyltransferase